MECCNNVPVYDVTGIAIDQTTGIATITADSPALRAGRFDLRFKLCCQHLSPCWTERLNLTAGGTTYANVLVRNGNFARLGQIAKQVNCCHILHCNVTATPAGNIMIMDKLPSCVFTGTVSNTPTVITVEE